MRNTWIWDSSLHKTGIISDHQIVSQAKVYLEAMVQKKELNWEVTMSLSNIISSLSSPFKHILTELDFDVEGSYVCDPPNDGLGHPNHDKLGYQLSHIPTYFEIPREANSHFNNQCMDAIFANRTCFLLHFRIECILVSISNHPHN